MLTRVWFNRWFSSVYHTLRLLRDGWDDGGVLLHASHDDPHALMLQLADVAFRDPVELGDDAYLDFAVQYCRRERIDVLWPRHRAFLLAEHRDRFQDEASTTVLTCADAPTMRVLDDKQAAYASLRAAGDGALADVVPEHRIVTTGAGFLEAVEELRDGGHRVCFKPVIATGGAGFRVIDETWRAGEAIFRRPGMRISLEEAASAFASVEPFRPVMVSQYLPGEELSIDCLGHDGRLLTAVPRRRIGGRTQELVPDEEATDIAAAICGHFGLTSLFNVQLRRAGDASWKLIEINPRMAGGTYASCEGSGINLPALALRLAVDGKLQGDGPLTWVPGRVGKMDHRVRFTPPF